MPTQQELIKDLQISEKERFSSVDVIYETSTKNPGGLRSSNINRGFNVIAASKLTPWVFEEPKQIFLKKACAVVRDYFSGPYIAQLREDLRSPFENPRENEFWFDRARRGLYLGFIGNSKETLECVANWVDFGMREDTGVDEVSAGINVLYEHICCMLRNEKLPTDFMDRFERRLGRSRKRNQFLGEMLLAIAVEDEPKFVRSLESFIGEWRYERKWADLGAIVSVDASVLCGLWERRTGITLDRFAEKKCIHLSR